MFCSKETNIDHETMQLGEYGHWFSADIIADNNLSYLYATQKPYTGQMCMDFLFRDNIHYIKRNSENSLKTNQLNS